MRVVIVSRGQFPGYDGPARRVKYLGAGLARNGCDVTLVVSYPPNPTPCDAEFEAAYGYGYTHTIRTALDSSTSIARKIYYKLVGTAKVYPMLKQMHRRRPVDAVLVCGVGLVELLVAWCLAMRLGVKIAVDKNDVNYRLKSQSRIGLYGFLSGINIALSDLLMIRCVDLIFTVNTHLYNLYARKAPGRVRYIIPSFIDTRELDDGSGAEEHFDRYRGGIRFLSVVTTPPHLYGFVPFAAALSALQARYSFRIYLLCSQEAETLRCVDELLMTYGLKARTKVLTQIAPEMVQSVYAGADIILNAQQEPAIAQGGFPGKTAEVLASRKPIVTTLFSDVHKYYVGGVNCLVVNYDDIASYVTALTALCDSPRLRERLGDEARRTALAFFEYVGGTRQLKEDLSALAKAYSMSPGDEATST